MQKKLVTKLNLKKAPESPGIYIFWADEIPLYIGKSLNLQSRLESYFSGPLAPKTARMISEANFFSLIKVGSELEALLLEAELVRANQPKYNIQLKDDKHPLYIRITSEYYPRVLTARKLQGSGGTLAFFGPFPSATNVKSVLKLVRRVAPFAQHKIGKRPCFYSQIGLCNPCPNYIEALSDEKLKRTLVAKYRKNIRTIRLVLSGRLGSVRRQLQREMTKLSKEERFEEAERLREQIERLDYITQPVTPVSYYLDNPNLIEDIRRGELKALRELVRKYTNVPRQLQRIECYDVSHLAGSAPTASMVTFIWGEPEKSLYRNFRINASRPFDDISSMKEVALRREKNLPSWGRPNLIIVDGGKAQAGVFNKVFKKHAIAVIGLAKGFETVVIPKGTGFVQVNPSPGGALNILQRARDEAHRFARRYHHKLLKKRLASTIE